MESQRFGLHDGTRARQSPGGRTQAKNHKGALIWAKKKKKSSTGCHCCQRRKQTPSEVISISPLNSIKLPTDGVYNCCSFFKRIKNFSEHFSFYLDFKKAIIIKSRNKLEVTSWKLNSCFLRLSLDVTKNFLVPNTSDV